MVPAFAGNVKRTDAILADGTQPIVDGFVNAFAVPLTTPGQVALIDCGNDPHGGVIKAALAAKQLTVAAIFITHGHADHIGGCAAFAGVPVFALQDEVDAIEGRLTVGVLLVTNTTPIASRRFGRRSGCIGRIIIDAVDG